MELHVLFICALPVLLSTAVTGRHSQSSTARDYRFNNTVIIQSGGTKRQMKKMLINTNSQSFIRPNDLHSVYNDNTCKPCVTCMERAIKARINELRKEPAPNSVELHNAIISSVYHDNKIRESRSVSDTDYSVKAKENPLKEKKLKTKKQKSITVTKYTLNGIVHAVKVKETTLEDGQSTCEVYSVTNGYPCQSPEGSSLIASVKKTKSKGEKTQTTTEKPVFTAALRKRDISNSSPDNTQIPENVMPSFEEYY